MKALFLTNEYPPNVYGGAGIHVEYITKELSKKINIDVRCFGDQDSKSENLCIKGYPNPVQLLVNTPDKLKSPLGALFRNISFNADPIEADIVHCHTWYSHFGGILAKLLYNIPLIITTHSLEPLRPWKSEQIGRGYNLSKWVEKTALEMADRIIAVSKETKTDILKNFNVKNEKIVTIPNGIDLEDFKFLKSKNVLKKYGIPSDLVYVLFVGRITRQKGIINLINAVKHLDDGIGVIFCAGSPDTKELGLEVKKAIEEAKKNRNDIYLIEEMLPREELIELYSNAAVFCCPSIYEPFGIINLEAMACETPVVGSKIGGIKEIVKHGETGFLVELEQSTDMSFEALFPDKFASDLAFSINLLANNRDLRNKMGKAGRKRVEEEFSWRAVSEKVLNLYKEVIKEKK